MSTVHIVEQGETLNRIARKYKFANSDDIYTHPDNIEFRKKRPNPNIIFPGDKVIIPSVPPLISMGNTNASYTFKVKRPVIEKFRVKIQNAAGIAWAGKRVVLNIGGQSFDAPINSDGVIEIDLPRGDESTGQLDVYMDPELEEPTHKFEVQLGCLDPIDELSGVQARCNLLGFDCGVADGIMGSKTREGVKAFQEAHGLEVDGVPGPMTKGKLQEVYGC